MQQKCYIREAGRKHSLKPLALTKMTEETQQNLIGRKVSASSFNELIESISSLITTITPGCSLITEEYLCKGMIAKYGMLDLTYKIIDTEEFVRI